MLRSWRILLPAAAVALMWFYEGFWCKVFPGRADQRAIVEGVPLLPAGAVTPLLISIGLAEVAIGLWALSGRRPWLAATVQTALVTTFNFGGLLFGADRIPEPGRLVVQDIAFVALIWTVAAAHRSRTGTGAGAGAGSGSGSGSGSGTNIGTGTGTATGPQASAA